MLIARSGRGLPLILVGGKCSQEQVPSGLLSDSFVESDHDQRLVAKFAFSDFESCGSLLWDQHFLESGPGLDEFFSFLGC